MLKLGRGTKFKMLFLVLVFVFNFDVFKFSAAILEKGLLESADRTFLHLALQLLTVVKSIDNLLEVYGIRKTSKP